MGDEDNKVKMDLPNTGNQNSEPEPAFKAYGYETRTIAGIPYVFGSVQTPALTPDPGPAQSPDPNPSPPPATPPASNSSTPTE